MAEMLYGNFRIELEANLGNQVDRTMPASPAAFTWRWPIPVDPPPALLGRDQELDQIRQAVLQRGPIQFYASCGFGVTTLLRYVAAGRPGVSVSAPYLYLRVGDDPLPDVLHRLVSAAFTSEGTIRPTPSLSAQLLATLQAVVVLDDVRSDPEVISYLVTAMPGCPVVVGSARPLLEDGSAPSHRLSGLPETAGLALLARNLARPVNTNELPAARRLWVAVEGQPLHLRQAAALVRAAEHTFAELAAAAERDPESLDRLAIDALPNPQRRVLAVLALAAGALLPPDLLSAMASVADIGEAISDLHAHGLAERHEDRFGLPICKVDTYRPQLLTYVDAGSAARELIRWLTSRDPADHVSLSVAEAALSLIGFAAEQGDLRTVVALVRVVEPILTLAGRWQVYSHALHQGMQAAQQLGDQVSQAYFAHQQGTLALCQDQLPAALQHLQHALELRRRLGDRRGAERTQHNLEVLQPTPPPTTPRPPRRRLRLGEWLLGGWLAELGDWLAEERARRQAEQPAQREAAVDERRLQAELRDGFGQLRKDAFVAGQRHQLRIRIAAERLEGAIIASGLFRSPTPGREVKLSVMTRLRSPGQKPVIRALSLPAIKDSRWTRPIPLNIPREESHVIIEVVVLHRGRTVQAATLSGPVVAGSDPVGSEGLVFAIDADTPVHDLELRTPADATIVLSPSLGDTPEVIDLTAGASPIRLDRLQESMVQIRQQLIGAFGHPPKDLAAAAPLLARLAIRGRLSATRWAVERASTTMPPGYMCWLTTKRTSHLR